MLNRTLRCTVASARLGLSMPGDLHEGGDVGVSGQRRVVGGRSEVLDVALLVRRAAEGDRWAWERLVDQFARLIWAMTREFKLVESDAADVFQATWLRLLEHIDRLEQPARVGSWLAATARHECLRSMAAREQTVGGVRSGLARFGAVHLEDAVWLFRQIHQVGH